MKGIRQTKSEELQQLQEFNKNNGNKVIINEAITENYDQLKINYVLNIFIIYLNLIGLFKRIIWRKTNRKWKMDESVCKTLILYLIWICLEKKAAGIRIPQIWI